MICTQSVIGIIYSGYSFPDGICMTRLLARRFFRVRPAICTIHTAHGQNLKTANKKIFVGSGLSTSVICSMRETVSPAFEEVWGLRTPGEGVSRGGLYVGCRCCCCSHINSSPKMRSVLAGQAPVTLGWMSTPGKWFCVMHHSFFPLFFRSKPF